MVRTARIPLVLSGGQIKVKASIVAPGLRQCAPFTMIVDTGSTSVVLSQRDAENLGLAVLDLPRSASSRIGYGGRMDAALLRNVLLAPTDTAGRTVGVPLQEVVVNRAASLKRKEERHVYSIPSVLGTDVMISGNLALYVHMNRGTAYLDSEGEAPSSSTPGNG